MMDMDLRDVSIKFIVVVVIIVILLLAVQTDIIADAKESLEGQFLISPQNVKVTAEREPKTGPLSGYIVKVQTDLAYLNPGSFEEPGDIEVVPIISFKGGGAHVFEGAGYKPLVINKQIIEIPPGRWEFTFDVKTLEMPFKRLEKDSIQDELVQENQGFVFTSQENGHFVIKAEKFGEDVLGRCEISFMVRCSDEIKSLKLNEEKDCIINGNRYECSDNLEVCNGFVEVQVNEKPDCRNRQNRMSIRVKGGIEDVDGKWTKEDVMISFWKKSQCIEKETDYWRLIGLCGLQRLSGRYVFKADSIS
jgi:hypothetical protein